MSFFWWLGYIDEPNELSDFDQYLLFWVDHNGGNNMITEDGYYFVFHS